MLKNEELSGRQDIRGFAGIISSNLSAEQTSTKTQPFVYNVGSHQTYPTILAAIQAIPITQTIPSIINVWPGIYSDNLVLPAKCNIIGAFVPNPQIITSNAVITGNIILQSDSYVTFENIMTSSITLNFPIDMSGYLSQYSFINCVISTTTMNQSGGEINLIECVIRTCSFRIFGSSNLVIQTSTVTDTTFVGAGNIEVINSTLNLGSFNGSSITAYQSILNTDFLNCLQVDLSGCIAPGNFDSTSSAVLTSIASSFTANSNINSSSNTDHTTDTIIYGNSPNGILFSSNQALVSQPNFTYSLNTINTPFGTFSGSNNGKFAIESNAVNLGSLVTPPSGNMLGQVLIGNSSNYVQPAQKLLVLANNTSSITLGATDYTSLILGSNLALNNTNLPDITTACTGFLNVVVSGTARKLPYW